MTGIVDVKLESKVLDLTKYRTALLNRIIHGANLELYIIENYSTNRLKQAKLYNEVVVKALDYLVGIEAKKDPIQLFEIIKEDDFNTRFMEILDWLEYKVTKEFNTVYREIIVTKVKTDNDTLVVEFTSV
jgi:hypothetical protein